MAKRKKKRKPSTRRTTAANPRKRKKKKAHHGTRRRAANPRKRKKARHASAARTRRANPRRRKKARITRHRVSMRARRANPGHMRRKKGKRRHRKNPGIPAWAMAGLAAVLGLVSFTVVSAGSFALTQRLDPSLGSLIRNRRIAGGAALVGGIALALVSPMLGAGLASGGLAVLAGTEATLALGSLIDVEQKAPPAGQQASPKTMSGVFNDGRQRFNSVFTDGHQRFGAVYDDGRQRFSGLMSGGSVFDGDSGFGG